MNVSLYLRKPLLDRIRGKARQEGVSLSRLVERLLEKSVEENLPSVPLKNLLKARGALHLGGDAVKDAENYHE